MVGDAELKEGEMYTFIFNGREDVEVVRNTTLALRVAQVVYGQQVDVKRAATPKVNLVIGIQNVYPVGVPVGCVPKPLGCVGNVGCRLGGGI